MKYWFLISLVFITIGRAVAQRERGNVINTPKIFQKKTNEPETSQKPEVFDNEVDFQFEEEPRLRFQNSFETKETPPATNGQDGVEGQGSPVKIEYFRPANETIHEDTSSLDEGQLMVVEIEEMGRFQSSEEMVKIASYYSIWDNHYVDPYGIDPTDFHEIVPIKLYDVSKGRYWSPPLKNCHVTSHFGFRWKRWHKGTDVDLDTGDPVYAAFDGIIRISGTQGGFGRCVVLRHYNGLETVYGHLSKLHFPENTRVNAGDEIGLGGNTGRSYGSHLHFETRYEGNPFDPENIFMFGRDSTKIKTQEFLMSSKMYDYLRGKSPRVSVGGTVAEPAIQPKDQQGEEEFEEEFEEEMPTEVVQKVWYRVKPGDNLTEIGKTSGTSVKELCQLNRISSYKKLVVGMRLRLR